METGATMCKESGDSVSAGSSDACARLQPFDEVLSVREDDGTIRCIPAGRRLPRVLVADDDSDTADSLSMLVTTWGHDVRVAYDGAAALQMASTYQPDVLLLD